jgi:hypothetical protein
MKRSRKFNPVAVTEGVILGTMLAISLMSTLVLAIFNYLHHS